MRPWLFALVVLLGCEKNNKPPPPTSGTPGAPTESGPGARRGPKGGNAAAEAQQYFMMVCATCHGPDGTGNTETGQALNPRPRNYTDPKWQASVTDDEIRTIILKGGAAVGKSAMMPAQQQQLGDKPEVVDGLVQIIRGFGKPK
jgi:mono/diheme cytochrome c family protein